MSALIILGIAVGLLMLDVLAQTNGVDSRPESADPRSPVRGVS
ncbi:MAG TPA: hypothetical protein VMQ65_06735 [Candidatus Limnocylindria bacterium]|nr:hypothetical protein [Candidatus Limnocylindria bacterium]